MKKSRLDEILIARGVVKTKAEAFVWVTEGRIFVEGQKAVSPAQMFAPNVLIRVKAQPKYVGRGGLKLEAALDAFSVSIEGKICADIGAATGGFTDVLLGRGAKLVYAIDVGRGKLALKLREDPRVVVFEGTNILYLESLPDQVEFAGVDVSFTSLRLVLPALKKFLKHNAEVIVLFKPQYEVEANVLSHGIVEDELLRREALDSFCEWAREAGWEIKGSIESPIPGTKGNIEYLVNLAYR